MTKEEREAFQKAHPIGREGLLKAAKDVGDYGPGGTPVVGGVIGDLGRRLAVGIGKGAQDLVQALIPGLDDKEKRQVAAAMSEGAGGLATVGDIGTKVGATILPATAIARAVPVAAGILPRALAAAGTGAAIGGATTPGDLATQEGLDERLKGVLMGALAGAGSEVGGAVLRKALTQLVTPSTLGKYLMERGVQPTLGQGAASPLYRRAEDVAAGIPITGALVRSGQKRALEEANKALAGRGSDPVLEAAANALHMSRGVGMGTVRMGATAYLASLLGIPVAKIATPVLAGATAGATAPVARLAMGGHEWQKELARALRDPLTRGAAIALSTALATEEDEQ
jgi:hypothetical protein